MPDPTNLEIAAALDELGDLYELDGAVIHRIVAYRNAAKAVRDASVSVTALARQGRAGELPGVGAIIQEKVLALADEGAIPAAVKLRAKFPPGLVEMTRLPGLGPKRARRLFDELQIDSLDSLRAVARRRFGDRLHARAGAKRHTRAHRDAAARTGPHVSGCGVLHDATGATPRCDNEAEVYGLLGLEYIAPELRENRGELEAAA